MASWNLLMSLFMIRIKKGMQIGQVTRSEDGSKGTFYLAIKENG